MPSSPCTDDPEFSGPCSDVPAKRGRAAGSGGNDRRCAVTRRAGPRDGMVRFVVAPDGTLTPDLAETLPGRGLWITASRDVLAAPGLARAAARSARRQVKVPADLPALIERLLEQRCRATLGLARRAGQVESGFDKVRSAIVSGEATLLLTARDSTGRDGRELARRVVARTERIRISTALDSAELGAAFGRERQVHVAVAGGSLADRLYRDLQRLAGVQGAYGPDGTKKTVDAASPENGETARESAQER